MAFLLIITIFALVKLVVKNLLASAGDIREAGSIPGSGRSPGREMATHSSIFAWRIQRTEEHSGLQSMESQSRTRLRDIALTQSYLLMAHRVRYMGQYLTLAEE